MTALLSYSRGRGFVRGGRGGSSSSGRGHAGGRHSTMAGRGCPAGQHQYYYRHPRHQQQQGQQQQHQQIPSSDASSTTATATTPSLPVLNPSQQRRTNKWVRPKDDSQPKADSTETIGPIGANVSSGDRTESDTGNELTNNHPIVSDAPPVVETSSDAVASKHITMSKQGHNRLVLSSFFLAPNSVQSRSNALDDVSSASVDDAMHPKDVPSVTSQTWVRDGSHKLVALHKGDNRVKMQQVQISQFSTGHKEAPRSHTSGRSTQTLHVNNTKSLPQKRQSHEIDFPNNWRYPPSSAGRPPWSLSRGARHPPTAKRIKLNTGSCGEQSNIQHAKSSEVGEDDEQVSSAVDKSISVERMDEGTTLSGNEHEPISKDKNTDKLTDFAYRETSLVRHRLKLPSQNLHWSKHDSTSTAPILSTTTPSNPTTKRRSKNMGLVRVQPNEKTTPICTTFLRGIDCTDPYCRKRHDVPKEHAMPVCSFFQRNGQCLKGDKCIFRHVKVNSRAMICPCFSLLGFCEDEHCVMQHIRGRSCGSGGASSAGKAIQSPAGRGGKRQWENNHRDNNM